ncbi:MAG: DcaP family trimeric outer membrane transporter [Chitinophagaceae bacterium]|nr:DcaP family trimeric outer membrane transporter [Chitinophagaceae bacterium]
MIRHGARKCRPYSFLLLLAVMGILQPLMAQTEFDSLKRNSMLDTIYQPSSKPTLTTEFADLKISGFIQPAFYFDNNNVFNNDLFVTSEIPTTRVTDIKFRRFHMSANQSRLGFGFNFPKALNKVTAFLEADFLSSTRGENAYFRLRHAYLKINNLVIGQTWTNFGDVNAAPNTLDLEGPNSMPASRVAQISWNKQVSDNWNVLVAIEEPKADYTPLPGAQALKSAFPELVLKPKWQFGAGHWTASVVYKPIMYTDSLYSFRKKLPTWGATSSFQVNLPDKGKSGSKAWKKKVFNLFAIVGEGTQGSVNDFGGLGYEAFPKDSVTLETLMYYGGYASFSAVYNKRWSVTTVYSYLHQQQPASTNNIFRRSSYFATNATYAFNKYFTAGTEVLVGLKENYDGSRGNAMRILCLMRLLF